jgi:hypothetical protein
MFSLAQSLKAKYFTKVAYIRKLPNGKWRVFSEKGKNLGTFDSQTGAKNHLREVEYFKHRDNNDAADEETYSSILRKLNKEDDQEAIETFMMAYKDAFDTLVLDGVDDPAEKALSIAQSILSRVK